MGSPLITYLRFQYSSDDEQFFNSNWLFKLETKIIDIISNIKMIQEWIVRIEYIEKG